MSAARRSLNTFSVRLYENKWPFAQTDLFIFEAGTVTDNSGFMRGCH